MFSGLKVEGVSELGFCPKRQFPKKMPSCFFLAISRVQLITKKKWQSLSDDGLNNEYYSTRRKTLKRTDILFELTECCIGKCSKLLHAK